MKGGSDRLSRAVLSRFEGLFYKDKVNVIDKAQVPLVGATVSFHRQGATASAVVTVPPTPEGEPNPTPTEVPVYDAGTLTAGDIVQAGTIAANVLEVTEVVSRTLVRVLNHTFADISIGIGDRLLRKTNQPSAFLDPLGTLSGGVQVTTDSEGRALAYIAEPRFDYVVTGGGLSAPRYFIDALGGTVPSPDWIEVADQPSLQASVDALPPDGGEVFISGKHGVFATLNINKPNVTLRGDGTESAFIQANANPAYDVVRVTKPGCKILNLTIFGSATQAGAGSCLVLSGAEVENCYLENVSLQQGGLHGLLLDGIGSMMAVNCESIFNFGAGIRLRRSTATPWKVRLVGCASSQNRGRGMWIEPDLGQADKGDSVLLLGCGFESNANVAGDELLTGTGLHVRNSSGVQVVFCYFEWNPAGSLQPEQLLLAVGAKSILVTGCWLLGKGGIAQARAKRGARFLSCDGATCTNNFGYGFEDEMILFDAGTTNGVEFGNQTDGITVPVTVTAQERRVFGLSAKVVRMHRYGQNEQTPATSALNPGALVFKEGIGADGSGRLMMYDGSAWVYAHYAS